MNELLQAECGLQEQHKKHGHPKHQGGPHLLSDSSQCSGGSQYTTILFWMRLWKHKKDLLKLFSQELKVLQKILWIL